MVMELNEAGHRESLKDTGDARPPGMPMTSDGVTEGKARRNTWAFNPVRIQSHATAEESHTRLFPPEVEQPAKLWKSNSSPSLHLQTLLSLHRTADAEDQTQNQPGLRRAHSQQASSGLAPIMETKYVEITTAAQSRGVAPKVKRWDARTRTTSIWDSLRRDSELFSQRGNCSIHLYEKGQSRRGPSFRIPLERIYSARFASLFTLFCIETARHDDFEQDALHRQCDLYVPAPESSRKEAFTWHITTRNFFAFILGRPVVGAILGQALIDLRHRLDMFRPNDPRNHEDFISYLEKSGYLEFAHCPEYALALLNFAEHFKLRDIWVDAFAHCVGMEALLRSHPEFHHVSRVTHALITRAYLEMDLHLGRVTRTLSNFLEDDFSPSNFGVSAGARLHLDRFRTFFNEYYVAKFGYWPPPKSANFSKSLYKSMYFDFRSLYDYLVDLDSTSSLADQKPASGGICVLQNVKAFDERHKMIPLPHPHPLIPIEPTSLRRNSGSQTSLMRTLKLGAKFDTTAEFATMKDAINAAANAQDASVICAPIVKAYQRFELDSLRRPEDKLTLGDARKIRWLLIYATLQMLISVTRAPKEVRMTETTYPLCCLVTGTPPWQAGTMALKSSHSPSVLAQVPSAKHVDLVSAVSIHPDCELDDYLSRRTSSLVTTSASRRTSTMSTHTDNSPIQQSRVGIFRNASIRSVKTLSSSIGSLSRRASSRRTSTPSNNTVARQLPLPVVTRDNVANGSKSSSFCEIVVHGYGNGLTESVYTEPSRFVPVEMTLENLPELVVSSHSPPRPQSSRSATAPEVRPRSSSRRNSKPDLLVLKPQRSDISEKIRTPLMNEFAGNLPGLAETSDDHSSKASDKSGSSTPPALCWSSTRSNSPDSSKTSTKGAESAGLVETAVQSAETADRARPPSPSFSESTISTLSPVSPTGISMVAILPSKKSMDLPMVVDIEEMNVYQPTGVPSVGIVQVVEDDDEEEFPDRDASKRWSVANKTHSIPLPLKSSLRRAHTAANAVAKRRSVKIKV